MKTPIVESSAINDFTDIVFPHSFNAKMGRKKTKRMLSRRVTRASTATASASNSMIENDGDDDSSVEIQYVEDDPSIPLADSFGVYYDPHAVEIAKEKERRCTTCGNVGHYRSGCPKQAVGFMIGRTTVFARLILPLYRKEMDRKRFCAKLKAIHEEFLSKQKDSEEN